MSHDRICMEETISMLEDQIESLERLIAEARKIIPALLAHVHTFRVSIGGKDGKRITEWLEKTKGIGDEQVW
jgi:hypothetical protein